MDESQNPYMEQMKPDPKDCIHYGSSFWNFRKTYQISSKKADQWLARAWAEYRYC